MTALIRYSGGRPGRSRVVVIAPRDFPAPVGSRLRAVLALAHAEQPFSPSCPREAAYRISELADRVGLSAVVYRGGLDVGSAELDHVWTVIDGRVVDPAVPLYSRAFVGALRAYVAGDLDEAALERAAHPYSLEYRVVGSYPDDARYVGAPVWGSGS